MAYLLDIAQRRNHISAYCALSKTKRYVPGTWYDHEDAEFVGQCCSLRTADSKVPYCDSPESACSGIDVSGSRPHREGACVFYSENFMTSSSIIDPDTIMAYHETHYCVEGNAPMTLLVGTRNASLAALHEAAHVESSAFITAWNPYSQRCDDEDNARRQEALSHELTHLGLRFIDGVGQHPSGEWPSEPSFLVLGISLEAARELGSRHEQNAIIWVGRDAVPQLVLLR